MSSGDTSSFWKLESLRLTGFFKNPIAIDATSWWAAFASKEPEEQKIQNGIQTVEMGSWAQGVLQVSRNTLRFDVSYSANQNSHDLTSSEMPNLGFFPESGTEFFETSKKYLTADLLLSRLALGCVLIRPVSDKKEAYSLLQGLLKGSVILDPDNSQDFFYQINRPRISKTDPKLEVNRVSKWNSLRFVTKQITVVDKQVIDATPAGRDSDYKYFIRLELDISSTQTPVVLNADKKVKYFEEFLDLTKEISVKGDIP